MSTIGSKPSQPEPQPQQFECLICATTIYNTNLGIDACRACTVFYRRQLNSGKKLMCRKGTDDCYEKYTRPLCRKCRFVRLSAAIEQPSRSTLTAAASKDDPSDPGSDSSEHISSDSADEIKKQKFIDHRSFNLFSTCSQHAPFFDRMKRGYSMLCFMRNSGELSLVNNDEPQGMKQSDGVVFYPINHDVKLPSLTIMSVGLKAFFEAVFEDFNALSEGSKKCILDKSMRLIHSLDLLYRAVHHFAEEEVMLPTYLSYINFHLIDFYVDKITESNKTEVVREMKNTFARNISMIRAIYKRVSPSNEEFLVMMGLSLWSNDASRLDDDYMKIVAQNRSAILNELHKFYTAKCVDDYSIRLGDILCLLESIEKNAESNAEDIRTIKLLKSMNSDVPDMCGMKCSE